MVRAKMCEQLAKLMQQSNSATFFTVGLLSVLDAFMDRPMLDILPALPLADEIVEALLAHAGMLGAILVQNQATFLGMTKCASPSQP